MGKLFASLEGLEEENVPGEAEGEVEAAMLAVMESDKEVVEQDQDLFDMDETLDEVDSSVEQLEALCLVIGQYGISAPMMKVADPDGYLIKEGICCAYEELSDITVKDEQAETTVEGIKDVVNNAKAKISAFMKKVGNKLKDWGLAVDKAFKTYDLAMQVQLKKIKGLQKIDEVKFKERSIRAFSKADFAKIAKVTGDLTKLVNDNVVTKLIEDIGTIVKNGNADITKLKATVKKASDHLKPLTGSKEFQQIIGIYVEHGSNDEVVELTARKSIVKDKRGTAGELGWKGSDAQSVLGEALKLHTEATNLIGTIDRVAKMYSIMFSDNFDKLWKKQATMTTEERAALVFAYNSARKLLAAQKSMLSVSVRLLREVAFTALQVGGAALKAKAE